MKKPSRAGIFLITTLFVIVFLTIMGVGVLSSVLSGMASSGSFAERELARQAALTGLTYLQARLESNCSTLAPLPDGPALSTSYVLPGLSLQEQGHNVVGLVTNQNVAGPGEPQMTLMFRASFNKKYGTYSADATWPVLSNVILPPMTYTSMNNLRSPVANAYNSYTGGSPFHAVQGGNCDIIVEGMVVRSDGMIRCRRTVEGVFNITDVSSLSSDPIAAGGNINLTMLESQSQVGAVPLQVGSNGTLPGLANAGLAAMKSITLVGQDPGSPAQPPGYTSQGKATVPVGQTFVYQQGTTGVPIDYSSNTGVVQRGPVQPPAIPPGNLPSLGQSIPLVNVTAGTWAVWNGQLYHYPVDYQAVNPVTQAPLDVTQQLWAPGPSGKPPLYQGLATDTPTGQTSLDGLGKLPLDTNPANATYNSIVINGLDVGITGAGAVQSFALVTVPNGVVTPYDGSPVQTLANTTQVTANLQMQAGSSGSGVQVRAAGSISIGGNVIGQGSLTTADVGGTVLSTTQPANITIVGKSQLDPQTDSGVALYAAGNVNVMPILPSQPPAAVASLVTTAPAPTGYSQLDQIVGLAVMAMSGASPSGFGAACGAPQYIPDPNPTSGPPFNPQSPWGNPSFSAITVYQAVRNLGGSWASATDPQIAAAIDRVVTANIGSLGSSDPGPYLTTGSPPGPWQWPPPSTVTLSPWEVIGTAQNTAVPATGFSYAPIAFTSVSQPWPVPVAVAAPTSSPSASGSPSAGPNPLALDQTFNGLMYAYGGVNIPKALTFTVNGALVTYGGDPRSTGPGTSNGDVDIHANELIFNFDPGRLGMYANLFGGKVTLTRRSVAVF